MWNWSDNEYSLVDTSFVQPRVVCSVLEVSSHQRWTDLRQVERIYVIYSLSLTLKKLVCDFCPFSHSDPYFPLFLSSVLKSSPTYQHRFPSKTSNCSHFPTTLWVEVNWPFQSWWLAPHWACISEHMHPAPLRLCIRAALCTSVRPNSTAVSAS
jgi:hypothetical protein